MIKPIHAIAYVLLGNIKLNEWVVPVVKQNYPYDKTPCITIDDTGGSATLQRNIINRKMRLPHHHPQYELYKKELVSQQCICEIRNVTLNINVWCDTERERDTICNKILDLFYKAQSDHYMFCSKYDNGFCSYLDDECKGFNDDNIRCVKNQCPKPEEYGYENIFSKFDLIRNTFNVEQPFSLDDLSSKKPVLRSIIKLTTSYKDYHVIGGAISQGLNFDEDLL